jgi:UDP-2,4-diacetamido-2,4,6-trideoxy-beta-L-altropyranose hydrolase
MRVAFRADASLRLGAGHVMRCLTLADRLAARGHACRFLTREQPGHMAGAIRARGHAVDLLPGDAARREPAAAGAPPHAGWHGAWADDARACHRLLQPDPPDWLVVDHYGLDTRWDDALAGARDRLLAIDDLADRPHACDLLLDQNLGRRAADYDGLVPVGCRRLIGPHHALLRPQFAARRAESLQRRAEARLERILVSMGGVDADDATGAVLAAIEAADLAPAVALTVVMGPQAPWLDAVRARATSMRHPAEVLVDVPDMAAQMARADLAIGAAGGTAWERCCLGLPALIVVLADNQRPGARALVAAGAARVIEGPAELGQALPQHLAAWSDPRALAEASRRAAAITDGLGADRVCDAMESCA